MVETLVNRAFQRSKLPMKSWFQLTGRQLYMAEKITLFCLGFNVIFSEDNLYVLMVYCLKL